MTEGPSLRRTVSVFLEALAARYGRRPRTIQTYRSALQRFLGYLTDIDLDPEHQTPEALDPAHVRDFIPSWKIATAGKAGRCRRPPARLTWPHWSAGSTSSSMRDCGRCPPRRRDA